MNATNSENTFTPFDSSQLERYRRELGQAGIFKHMEQCRREFDDLVEGYTARGYRYGFGALTEAAATQLYGVVREFRPLRMVETGVCNGVSTLVILAALERNGDNGRLWSIDLPEEAGKEYPEGYFWKGKRGAAVPPGRQPGWILPDSLRQRWQFVLGRSQEVLPGVLEEVGELDMFFHDSEHSPECMSFEYRCAWPRLDAGGVLLSDDTNWNSAFSEFAELVNRPIARLSRGLAFVVK